MKEMKKDMLVFILVLILVLFGITVTLFAQPVPDFKSLIGNEVTITARAETENSFWLGTNKGVYRIKKKNMKVIHYDTHNSLLPSNRITCICNRPDGQLYIGTAKGILRYDNFTFILINSENFTMTSDYITGLHYDSVKGVLAETKK